MSSAPLLQRTEMPSTFRSESVDYDPHRSEIIQQMVLRKHRRSNGNTIEHVLKEWDSGLLVPDDQIASLDLPEFKPNPITSWPVFIALQEWEGYVIEIHEKQFTADLIGKSTGDMSETEKAEFLISDVADDDLDLLKLGAIFRWSIGYLRDRRTKFRVSQIVFRRLPQWRKEDLAEAREQAKLIANAIPWK